MSRAADFLEAATALMPVWVSVCRRDAKPTTSEEKDAPVWYQLQSAYLVVGRYAIVATLITKSIVNKQDRV